MDYYKYLPNSLDWLTESDDSSQTITSDRINFQPAPISDEVGSGWVELYQLEFGMDMFHQVCRFNPDSKGMMVPLAEYFGDYSEECVSIMTQLSGRSCYHEQAPKCELSSVGCLRCRLRAGLHYEQLSECELSWEPGLDFFRRTNTARGKFFLDASQTNEMIGVKVSSSALMQLVGESAVDQFFQSVGLEQLPCAIIKPVPRAITSSLQLATSRKFFGQTRKVYAQAKVLEYLGLLMANFSLKVSRPDLKKSRDVAYDLRAYLIRLEGKLPTLQELAQQFGMSTKKLNEAFINEFGQSVYRYVMNYRLDQSHAILMQTDIPMKVISYSLGYSHVNHYITAFRKKFGYSPGVLRKKRNGGIRE